MKRLMILAAVVLTCAVGYGVQRSSALVGQSIVITGCVSFTGLPPNCGYTGPGDVVSGWVVWGSCFRAYNAAYATGSNAGCNLRRASDSHTCDVLIATNGFWGNTANCSTGADNGQTASSFCASTSCFVAKMYDQSGNSNNASQATAADQPQILFSGCNLTFGACMDCTPVSTQGLKGASEPGAGTLPISVTAVFYDAAADTGDLTNTGSTYFTVDTTPELQTYAGVANINQAISTGQWYAGFGVMTSAGTSCVTDANGTSTSGTCGTNAPNNPYQVCWDQFNLVPQAQIMEVGYIASALNSTQLTNLTSNERNAWGF